MKKKVKLIIFSQITASEESSRKKGFFCKSQFLLFEKILKAILFYGNKANVTSSCVKGFSREFENYCNKCVSSNILEKKKIKDKNLYNFLRFLCLLQIQLTGIIQLQKWTYMEKLTFMTLDTLQISSIKIKT